jgi:flavin reductase (DIM6/NTAB) family NADH-FMN oxidoreductase RutF
MPIEADAFKRTLSRWASGVTIVTSQHDGVVHGMTVSAFASVSLAPPLVLICVAKSSNTYGFIRDGRTFGVSILAEGQEDLSNRFASKEEEDRRFEGLECTVGPTGCPRIPGAVATLDCRVVRETDAGDHVIYLGEVVDLAVTDLPPLVYHRGSYHKLVR